MIRLLSHLHWWRHDDLDMRVAQARVRAEDARGEAQKSRVRQEAAREHVIMPLREAAERNGFADLIRDSLTEGYGKR
jgi:hypothetical protein